MHSGTDDDTLRLQVERKNVGRSRKVIGGLRGAAFFA